MTEEEVKEMHRQAKQILDDLNYLSESSKRILINSFKNKWWGLTPQEALRIEK